jgi:hypothetical protein
MKRRFDWSTEVKQATGHSLLLLAMLSVVCGCVVLGGCASSSASTKVASAIGVDAAVLGGTPAAFTATYGHPAYLEHVHEYVAATGEQVVLWLNSVASAPERGPRVAQLFIGPANHQPWDAATAERLYRAFFPADAVHLRDVDTAHGTHHLFRSAALAATLPFTYFEDPHGHALDQGTFDAVCAAGAAAQPSGFACFVAAGMIAV